MIGLSVMRLSVVELTMIGLSLDYHWTMLELSLDYAWTMLEL